VVPPKSQWQSLGSWQLVSWFVAVSYEEMSLFIARIGTGNHDVDISMCRSAPVMSVGSGSQLVRENELVRREK